ncbi:WD40 repeat domain-containing protein [Nocardia vinacea]|nr:WD40 repeat domain-containing protein [Nocardia vinacea]
MSSMFAKFGGVPPTAPLLATAGGDATVRVWDAASIDRSGSPSPAAPTR